MSEAFNFSKYKLLSFVNNPQDVKALSKNQLQLLCEEVRDFTIQTVSKTGGHLGAALGVVELTIALHYVFNAPEDKIVWDIGHQGYPHKILTERKEKMHTIRKPQGLSGFLNIFESKYDSFGAGHSSTSVSAGLGMVAASKLLQKNNHVVAIIGDGAISAGMAYEAFNNAAEIGKKMIVVLNDNNMSISAPTGAFSRYLPRLTTSAPYNKMRDMYFGITKKLGLDIIAKRAEKSIKDFAVGSNVFEEMGFRYICAVDGHNVEDLVKILENIKYNLNEQTPVLLHIKTTKGKGYEPAENAEDKFHGVSTFNIETGEQKKSGANYSNIFASHLTNLASEDTNIVAITAAMKSGTGLSVFNEKHPNRLFDVGIAEQHAVTFAAGLAIEGVVVFCCIYSTFLQRAYDQVIHDVCIQNLPVRFVLDRAGFVGADGATHNGVFDVAFLRILPNISICSASDEVSLVALTNILHKHNSSPIALRFGKSDVIKIYNENEQFYYGKAKVLKQAKNPQICLVGFGITVKNCLDAYNLLDANLQQQVSIVDAVFAKPIDTELFASIAQSHKHVICVEENSIGGLATILLEFFYNYKNVSYQYITLPDEFTEHDSTANIHNKYGFSAEKIVEKIQTFICLDNNYVLNKNI